MKNSVLCFAGLAMLIFSLALCAWCYQSDAKAIAETGQSNHASDAGFITGSCCGLTGLIAIFLGGRKFDD